MTTCAENCIGKSDYKLVAGKTSKIKSSARASTELFWVVGELVESLGPTLQGFRLAFDCC